MDPQADKKLAAKWPWVAAALMALVVLSTPLILLSGGFPPLPERDLAARKAALDSLTERGLAPVDRLARLQRAADDERRVLVEVSQWESNPIQVRQDEHFTAGRLHFAAGDAISALAEAERGLGLGRANTLFVANLHALRGTAREASGQRAEAIVDYAFSVAVHRSLYEAAVADRNARQAPGNP